MFKYNGRMDVPDENDNRDATVVEELQDLFLKEELEYHGWHKDHGEDFDNGEDHDEPLFQDETLFEIRLPIDVDIESLYDDEGKKISQYVSAALDFRPYHISNCHDREYESFVKTIIEISVGNQSEI